MNNVGCDEYDIFCKKLNTLTRPSQRIINDLSAYLLLMINNNTNNNGISNKVVSCLTELYTRFQNSLSLNYLYVMDSFLFSYVNGSKYLIHVDVWLYKHVLYMLLQLEASKLSLDEMNTITNMNNRWVLLTKVLQKRNSQMFKINKVQSLLDISKALRIIKPYLTKSNIVANE